MRPAEIKSGAAAARVMCAQQAAAARPLVRQAAPPTLSLTTVSGQRKREPPPTSPQLPCAQLRSSGAAAHKATDHALGVALGLTGTLRGFVVQLVQRHVLVIWLEIGRLSVEEVPWRSQTREWHAHLG